ncbi:hypothetical protein DY000_02018069 [Brassica cretica]|nr:hypothetical protein DY000_02018069 [Brassica cretica]
MWKKHETSEKDPKKVAQSLRSDQAQAKIGRHVAPSTHPARSLQDRSLRSDRASVPPGRYVATELEPSSVATKRPSTRLARSLRSDRAHVSLGRYVALKPSSVTT